MTKKEYLLRLSGEVQKAVFNIMWQKTLLRSKDLVNIMQYQSSTINKCLIVLIEKGFIVKVERGLYELSDDLKKEKLSK